MKFCTKCGAQIEDQTKFCNKCGAPQAAAQAAPQAAPQPAPQAAPQVNVNVVNQTGRFSDWDGGVFETFINALAASLIISLTCGLATPWAVCYMMKYIVSHAVVDGKRLVFTGTGGSLFGQWIKWFLLSIITCGIYSFWVMPRMYKWIVSNIHTAN